MHGQNLCPNCVCVGVHVEYIIGHTILILIALLIIIVSIEIKKVISCTIKFMNWHLHNETLVY